MTEEALGQYDNSQGKIMKTSKLKIVLLFFLLSLIIAIVQICRHDKEIFKDGIDTNEKVE